MQYWDPSNPIGSQKMHCSLSLRQKLMLIQILLKILTEIEMKALGTCVLLLVVSTILYGQEFKDELKVGDRLPVVELKNMVNYPSKTLKFSDHKPKLTILDFWGTGCGGCVVAWPKMLALQKEFGQDLQVILVNPFEDEKTNK